MSDGTRPGELAALAELAARRAGALLVELVPERAALAGAARSKTSLTDLVSSADLASERRILEELTRVRPGDGILAEEGSERTGSTGVTWVIDPLDGTINFLYGYGSFTVSIAATGPDGALAGAVFDPLRDECFVAALGGGATLNGRPLGPHPVAPLELALIGTGFGYRAERRAEQASLVAHLLPRIRDIRRSGSAALDLCSVATGRLDGYYEAGLGPWDAAAGRLIAEESGCATTEVDHLVSDCVTLVVARQPLLAQLHEALNDAHASAAHPKP